MPVTLSQLNTEIKQVLDEKFRSLTFDLVSEIGQITIKKETKIAYLDLVEKGNKPAEFIARSQAQIWSSAFNEIASFEKITGQKLTAGITILMKVNVSFHAVYGLKINILSIDAQYTLGALAQAKENTVLKLLEKHPQHIQRIDGKITSYNQRHVLPNVIQRIAFITGNQAEGGIDFIHELSKNPYGYQFELVPFIAVMQGEKSADSIREQLIKIFESKIKFDVVVIVRGGGAQLDLHAYDQYPLIEAMIRFPFPIFTGIGHTRNVSLADEVAFAAFKSPTKVAEVIVQHQKQFEDKLLAQFNFLLENGSALIQNHIINLKNTLYDISIEANEKLTQHHRFLNEYLLRYENTASRLIGARERKVLHLALPMKIRAQQKINKENLLIDQHISQIQKGFTNKIKQQFDTIQSQLRFISSQHPNKWISKGFALVYKEDNIVTSAAGIQPDENLEIMLQDGRLQVNVINKKINGEE